MQSSKHSSKQVNFVDLLNKKSLFMILLKNKTMSKDIGLKSKKSMSRVLI